MLTVHFYDGDSRTYTYSIDASTNGSDWTQIVASTTVHGLATHTFDPAINLRYARVNVTAQSINNFAHIYEIKLYKTTATTSIDETGDLQQVGVGAGDLAGNTAVATYVVRPMADLSLTKTSTPASLRPGAGNLTYDLTVTNHGPSTATAVQMTDNLPIGLTYVSSTPSQGSCTGTSSVICTLGELANGASATVSIVVTPPAHEATYNNTASVSATSIDSNPTNNMASVSTVVGNPLVYVVIAIDTEADNNHPMETLHTTFDVHNYQRVSAACPSFMTDYSGDGSAWSTYPDGATFNFEVVEAGQTDPATSFTCGTNNAYGLDDYARAVRFTVPSTGNYDVRVQLSVVGNPPDTNLYVVPDLNGHPDTAQPISTYTAHAASIVNGAYATIGSNLALQAGVAYWWVAGRQASGDDGNQFAVYQGSNGASNTFSQIMDGSFRSANTDSIGQPFEMTWYLEMDNFINSGLYADGTPMNYLTLYNELMNNWSGEVSSYGDEIAYHHHFMYWDTTANPPQWVQGGQAQAATGPYDEHNNALDRMVLDAGFFPTDFRAGWLNNDNQLQAWVDKWMLADVGGAGWATGWSPYHPSAADYTQAGDMNHWIANCPGGPGQDSVDAAFNQAIAENRPVVYCWYMHQRDDMRSLVAAANTYLHNANTATGVPFEYVTAKAALQAVIGTADKTSPTLSITPAAGDNYTITSNETLWGSDPYVAIRYGEGISAIYQHVAATPAGSNTWALNVPPVYGVLELKQVGAGALDLSGNSVVANYDTNQPPVAVNDAYNTNEDIVLNIAAPGLLANDTDADSNPLIAIKVTDPAHGTLTLNGDGSLTYIPAADFNGSDSFMYHVSDGHADSNTATVTLDVAAVNDAPSANVQSVNTAEDTAVSITLTGSDVEGSTLTFAIVTPPAHGALSGAGSDLTYTPALNYNGPDSFIFTVSDGTIDSAPATISIDVTPVNDAPVANAQSVTTDENVGVPIMLTGSDIEGPTLTFIVATQPAHGTLTGAAPALTYTPALNYSGPDSFTFTVNDGEQSSQAATVTIDVHSVTPPPVLPSTFYGEIHFANDAPQAGDSVSVQIAGVSQAFSTEIAQQPDQTLTYRIDLPGDVMGTPEKEGGAEGDGVAFSINRHIVATGEWHSGTHTQLDFHSTSVTLQPGWNLVSFSLLPVQTNIAEVLADLAGNYDLVYAWDASGQHWLKYDATGPVYGNTLNTLDHTLGFWIHLTGTQARNLAVFGRVPASTTISLVTGWNLVGYPSAIDRALPAALSGVSFGLVYAYHAAEADQWKLFDPGATYSNDLTQLTSGWGYWIRATSDANWTITYYAP